MKMMIIHYSTYLGLTIDPVYHKIDLVDVLMQCNYAWHNNAIHLKK